MNIREIARLSGVSIATVTRVINTPQQVQDDPAVIAAYLGVDEE